MRRFAWLTLVTLFLSVPPVTHGQLLGEPVRERTTWALEASAFANQTHFELAQVNENITAGSEYFHDQSQYDDVHNLREFDDDITYELRLGGRVKSVHFGLSYVSIPERQGGYLLEGSNGDVPYQIAVLSREYYFYLGYLHPFNRWFEAGVVGSIGIGAAEGKLTDAVKEADHVDMNGSYNPLRLEARIRVKLTRYVSVDAGIGVRNAVISDMEADYGVEGVHGIEGSQEPVLDYTGRPMDFDFSGWYAGGGITLLNPYGD
ncbi:MAG: hypothetical protein MAG453_00556 [Calditrichaeota bacterium]|nr:hypothetical protein [Calditrichota bacterium]